MKRQYLQLCGAVSGAMIPERIVLSTDKDELILGRQRGLVDVCMDSRAFKNMISRRHCKLVAQQDDITNERRWRLLDLGSANGLFVNNVKVSEAMLKDGDRVMFGGGFGLKVNQVLSGANQKAASSNELVYCFHDRFENENENDRKRFRTDDDHNNNDDESLKRRRTREKALAELEQELVAKAKELKAKEEAIKYQSTEELEKLQRQIDEERMATAESQALHEELRVLLEKQQDELDQLKTATIDANQIQEEFMCSICQDLIVHAAVIVECNHAYCMVCIQEWLQRQSFCPMCRQQVSAPPMHLLQIDNLIEKIADKLPADERSEFRARCDKAAANRNRCAASVAMLRNLIAKANARSLDFLKVTNIWTSSDCDKFEAGLRPFASIPEARELYCSTIGLTPEWVSSAYTAKLRVAMKNVRIKPNAGANRNLKNMRAFVIEYIKGQGQFRSTSSSS